MREKRRRGKIRSKGKRKGRRGEGRGGEGREGERECEQESDND